MKFNCGPSESERYAAWLKEALPRARAGCKALKNWHPHFAFLPVRIGESCYWLEWIERRIPSAVVANWNAQIHFCHDDVDEPTIEYRAEPR